MTGLRRWLTVFVMAQCLSGAVALLGQDVPVYGVRPVAIGAITRDVGLYVGPSDLQTMRGVNRYLVLLEGDLADRVSRNRSVSYQDRTATAELLHEVHMTTGRDFDPTSGALRGLMGRLDLLVVIDALDPATARMRLIDVESGSVLGVQTCSKRVSENSGCVVGMASRIDAASRERQGLAGALATSRQAIMEVKPGWDDAVARYNAARDFWANTQRKMGSERSLRPEIQTLLNGAATDVSRGNYAIQHYDLDTLRTAAATLSEKLNRLDQFR